MPSVEWNYETYSEKPLQEGLNTNDDDEVVGNSVKLVGGLEKTFQKYTKEIEKSPTSNKSEAASLKAAAGIDPNTTKEFTTSIVGLIKLIRDFILNVEEICQSVLNNREKYDIVQWLATKAGNVASGNISAKNELIKTFEGSGTELQDLFAKAELNALEIEDPSFTPDGQLVHDIIYDFLLFPFALWATYNWYYRLFYPLAKCPPMKDYSKYYEMLYPGIIMGHFVLPLYEFNKGLSIVNNLFSYELKAKWPLVFFGGSFVAVYYLWLRGIAQFDVDKMEKGVSVISYINVIILVFGNYMKKHPVTKISGALVLFLILLITLGFAKTFHKIIYIIVMSLFIYFSFFVLIKEKETWNVLRIMDEINASVRMELNEEDSLTSIRTWLKLVNNYIFTCPMLILLCFVSLSHLGQAASLSDTSKFKGFTVIALVMGFMVAALYSVLVFKNQYFGPEGMLLKKISLTTPPGQGTDPAILAKINAAPSPHSRLYHFFLSIRIPFAIMMFIVFVVVLPIVLIMKKKG